MDSNSDKTNRIFSSLYNPLMTTVRILEDYFINYTSNYVIATNYTINENSNDWSKYFKTKIFIILFSILMFYLTYLLITLIILV